MPLSNIGEMRRVNWAKSWANHTFWDNYRCHPFPHLPSRIQSEFLPLRFKKVSGGLRTSQLPANPSVDALSGLQRLPTGVCRSQLSVGQKVGQTHSSALGNGRLPERSGALANRLWRWATDASNGELLVLPNVTSEPHPEVARI